MGDDNKRKFEPGATMQIDLDQVQLVDLDGIAKSRKAPPPLPPQPPEAAQPSVGGSQPPAAPRTRSVAPSRAPAPPAGGAKNLMYIGIIVVVVALAVVAGLAVGRGVGGRAASAAPSALPPAAPSASASGGVLELPPFEVK